MTPADLNELIDRATRVALSDDPEARSHLEEHLISRVSIADLIAIRDGDIQTIGTRLIADLIWGWNFA